MSPSAARATFWSPVERWSLGLVSALAITVMVAGVAGLRINLSVSQPGLLYWRLPPGDVAVGDLVAFCLPFPIDTYPIMKTASRRLCAADQTGDLVLKQVMEAHEGDRLWVEGIGPNSLDSRVFGAIPRSAVKYRVANVW